MQNLKVEKWSISTCTEATEGDHFMFELILWKITALEENFLEIYTPRVIKENQVNYYS